MIEKSAWRHLIPHHGTMCLLDTVVSWDDDTIELTTATHREADNPLRSDGQLRSVHLCEYGAQAMAVHGGLLAQRDEQVARPGFLVSLRGIRLHVARIDDLPELLTVRAHKLLAGDSGWQYEFRIEHAGYAIAEGRAVVAQANGLLRLV